MTADQQTKHGRKNEQQHKANTSHKKFSQRNDNSLIQNEHNNYTNQQLRQFQSYHDAGDNNNDADDNNNTARTATRVPLLRITRRPHVRAHMVPVCHCSLTMYEGSNK